MSLELFLIKNKVNYLDQCVVFSNKPEQVERAKLKEKDSVMNHAINDKPFVTVSIGCPKKRAGG